jgi:hypothetical protein
MFLGQLQNVSGHNQTHTSWIGKMGSPKKKYSGSTQLGGTLADLMFRVPRMFQLKTG